MTFSNNLNWITYTHKIVSLHTNYFLATQNYIFIGYLQQKPIKASSCKIYVPVSYTHLTLPTILRV